MSGKLNAGERSEESSVLDHCQHSDNESFRAEGDFRKRRNECGRKVYASV
jgi:hypothetical protein